MRYARKWPFVAVCTAGMFAVASTALAQEADAPEPDDERALGARKHDGFYFQATAGPGYYNSSTEASESEKAFSGITLSSSLLLGGTPFRGLVLGGGALLDYAGAPTYRVNGEKSLALRNFTQFLIGMGPFVDYYPDPAEGLHFQAFLGFGGLKTSVGGNVRGDDPSGVLVSLGGGYDWWIGDDWSVGALARFTYAPLSMSGEGYSTIAPALLANFTYH